jgi:hypothetical protein
MALRHHDKLTSLTVIDSVSEIEKAMRISFELLKKLIRELGTGEGIIELMA